MEKFKTDYSENKKIHCGFTIVELVVTVVVAMTLLLTVGALLAGGQKAWRRTYKSAHKKIKQDAQNIMVTFGKMGRKSNRLNYIIYEVHSGSFESVEIGSTEEQEVVSGDAVEFRYWDVGLDAEDSHDLLEFTKTATAYAFFYLDGDELKVDYGPYPPGAVSGGGSKNIAGVTTVVLAENVSTDPDMGAFSHTTINGVGQGSVRINVTVTDPEDGESIKVMTATLMRNVWPR